MLIAVTTVDEVNFTSCLLAGKLGVKRRSYGSITPIPQ